jgi:progressive ankylosis protein
MSAAEHRTGFAPHIERTNRAIFVFWAPLAVQWLMMALEGPFLAAVIARMAEPAFNLAAYGVSFAFAILVESPVIMLMSASTALVEDAPSYRRLRAFANALNAGATGLLLFVLVPPVFDFLMRTLIGLPPEVATLVYGSLWLLLPWPAAIGYRRFLHGVLIRSGRTRLVAYGTALRIVGMAATALTLYAAGGLPGAWVGAAALSAGVCVEAIATRVMARSALRELLAPGDHLEPRPAAATAPFAEPGIDAFVPAAAPAVTAPAYRDIAAFYYPLAVTSFIGLTVHPLLAFFMGRSAAPVESLAVFPVVHALSFLFRSVGFSFQEAAIALLGRRCEHLPALGRFATILGLGSSAAMALVAFTPLADVWFETVSGLPADLAAFAVTPARILVPLPALAVLLALQQAVLVQGRTTGPVSTATVLEVATIAVLFVAFGWGLDMTGVDAAMLALLGGRIIGNAWLLRVVARVTRQLR